MNTIDREILNELKSSLFSLLGQELNDIILFGSHVANKATKESDMDVLIVLNKPYDWKKNRLIRDVCYETGLKFDIFIDSKIISMYELNHTLKGTHPLYKEALGKGIYA